MNTERLLQLAAHLDTVPAAEFDMSFWGDRHDCGAVCCAFGHACLIPEFREAGLRMAWDAHGCGMPVFREDWYGFDAASGFFDLSRSEAEYLFSDSSYPDEPVVIVPQHVAARIRELVASHGAAA